MADVVCSNCGRANPDAFRYCVQCGATLRQQANQESERQALRSQLGAVQSQLLQISQRLERLQARLAQLESDDETQPVVSPPAPASQLVAEQPAGDAPVRSEQLSDAAPAPSEPTGAVPPQPAAPEADEVRHSFTRPPDFERPTPPPVTAPGMPMREGADVTNAGPSFTRQPPRDPFAFLQRIDWEQVLGRNLLAIIGAVTLVLGIGFFLKLSLDNNWINDTGRVLLGFAAGAGLLGHRRVCAGTRSAMVAGGDLGRHRHPLPYHLRRLRPVRAHPARRCLCAACCSRGAGGASRAALQRHGHRRPRHRRGLHPLRC